MADEVELPDEVFGIPINYIIFLAFDSIETDKQYDNIIFNFKELIKTTKGCNKKFLKKILTHIEKARDNQSNPEKIAKIIFDIAKMSLKAILHIIVYGTGIIDITKSLEEIEKDVEDGNCSEEQYINFSKRLKYIHIIRENMIDDYDINTFSK